LRHRLARLAGVFYAWLMNWERIGVYDGSWCEWSRDPANPVVCRFDARVALKVGAGTTRRMARSSAGSFRERFDSGIQCQVHS